MWCQYCKTYIPMGAEKCPGCGRPAAEAAPENESRPAPPNAPQSDPQTGAGSPWPAQSSFGATSQTPWTGTGGQASRNAGWLGFSRRELISAGVGAAAGVLLGAGGASVVNHLLQGSPGGSPTSAPTPTATLAPTATSAATPTTTITPGPTTPPIIVPPASPSPKPHGSGK